MNEAHTKPPGAAFWFSTLAIVAGFLLFAVFLYVAYLPTRQKSIDPAAPLSAEQRVELNILTPEERTARLLELRARERAAATTYVWIDKEKGLVRLPIERAMELTLQELGRKD